MSLPRSHASCEGMPTDPEQWAEAATKLDPRYCCTYPVIPAFSFVIPAHEGVAEHFVIPCESRNLDVASTGFLRTQE